MNLTRSNLKTAYHIASFQATMEQAIHISRKPVIIWSNHCQCYVYGQPCRHHSFSKTSEGSISIDCRRKHAAYDCGVTLHDCGVDPAHAMQTQPGDGGLVLKLPHCDCFFHLSVCLAVRRIQVRQYGFAFVECGCRIDLHPCRPQATDRGAQPESVGVTNRQVSAPGGPSGAHFLRNRGTTSDFPIIIDDENLEVSHVVATGFDTGRVAGPYREPEVGPKVGQYSQPSNRCTHKRPARSPIDQSHDINDDNNAKMIQGVTKREEQCLPRILSQSKAPSPAPYWEGVNRLLSPAVSDDIAVGSITGLPNRLDKAGSHNINRQLYPYAVSAQCSNVSQSRSAADSSQRHNAGHGAGSSSAVAHATFLTTPSGRRPSTADLNLRGQGRPNGRPQMHRRNRPQANEEEGAHTQTAHASDCRNVLARNEYNDEDNASGKPETIPSTGSIEHPNEKPENGQVSQYLGHLFSIEDLGAMEGPSNWYRNPAYLASLTTIPESMDLDFAGPPSSPEMMDITDEPNFPMKDQLGDHRAPWPASASGNTVSGEQFGYHAPYVSDIAESSDDATASQGSRYLPTANLSSRTREGGQQPKSANDRSGDKEREVRKRKRSDGSPTDTPAPARNSRSNIHAQPRHRPVRHHIRRPFLEPSDIDHRRFQPEGTSHDIYDSDVPSPSLGSASDLLFRPIARNTMQHPFAHDLVEERFEHAKNCQGANRRNNGLAILPIYYTVYSSQNARWLDQCVAPLIQFASILVAVGVARFLWA